MNRQSDDGPSPAGVGLAWASRIFAITAIMVLPGLAGQWLDARLGTGFLVIIGFAVGISLAIWNLLVLTRQRQPKRERLEDRQQRDGKQS